MIPPKNLRTFRGSVVSWYRGQGRELPWRRTRDPYAILVSEVMLQQTQVATVIPYYNEWLRRFPTPESLAQSEEGDLLRAWEGLGYYSRARHLHAAAKTLQDQYGGRFPVDPGLIRELPGVGRYTANAVATFAFNQSVPIVEANIARLLTRVFNYRHPIDSTRGRKRIWHLASTLVPKNGAGLFNSALMELGALVCRPRPRCQICPIKKFCRATKPETLPRKRPRAPLQELVESHGWIRKGRRLLLRQSTGRWRGLWILPPLKERSTSAPSALHESIFPFTNHRVTLRVFARRPPKSVDKTDRWCSLDSLASIPIPSPHRRAIDDLLSRELRRRN